MFDIRKEFGCTDMLVHTSENGAALADTLGMGKVCLMRGHGFVTAGDSVVSAVFQAVYTNLNASLQLQAIMLGGEVTYLEADEAARAWETNHSVLVKPWELWKKKAARRLRLYDRRLVRIEYSNILVAPVQNDLSTPVFLIALFL